MSICSNHLHIPRLIAVAGFIASMSWLTLFFVTPQWVYVDSPNNIFGPPTWPDSWPFSMDTWDPFFPWLYLSAVWIVLLMAGAAVTRSRGLEALAVVSGCAHFIASLAHAYWWLEHGYSVARKAGFGLCVPAQLLLQTNDLFLAMCPLAVFVAARLRPNTHRARHVLAPAMGGTLAVLVALGGVGRHVAYNWAMDLPPLTAMPVT